MKTEINLKQILKFIHPFKNGVIYQGEFIQPDLKELTDYINNPKTKAIFSSSQNKLEAFYKNTALYIINSNNTSSYISLDIDKEMPIEAGLFELVKAIYLKEENIYISIPDNGNNLSFIKKNKLVDNLELTDEKIKPAFDKEMSNFISFEEKSNIIEALDKTNKDNNLFFWNEEQSNLYDNNDYIFSQINTIVKQYNYKHDKSKDFEQEFLSILKKISEDVLHDDDFVIQLLSTDNVLIIEKVLYLNSKGQFFNFDLSTQRYKDAIFTQIENNQFRLLKHLYESQNTALNQNDLIRFINHPNCIAHLLNQYVSDYSFSSTEFTFLNAFQFFNEDVKRDEKVIAHLFKCVTRTTSSSEKYISSPEKLLYLPDDILSSDKVLISIIEKSYINETIKLFNNKPVVLKKLKNIDFFHKLFPSLQGDKAIQYLDNFFSEKDITKELILKIVKIKPNSLANSGSSFKHKILLKLKDDFDINYEAYQAGVAFHNISRSSVLDKLLVEDPNPKKEAFKLNYCIAQGFLYYPPFRDKELVVKFKEKYLKHENLYFCEARDSTYTKDLPKGVGKIKTKEDAINILNKINEIDTDIINRFSFNSFSFYSHLDSELKNDIEIFETLREMGTLPYERLSETLKFNKNIILESIGYSPSTIKSIPLHYFNDTSFSLEFAKLMDIYGNNSDFVKNIPPFIGKFFENQNVTENYHQYLSTYISAQNLSKQLTDRSDSKPKRLKV